MSQGILQRSWKILQESCRIFHNSCNLRINQTVDSINLINLHRDGSMAGSNPILQRCNDPAPCQWKLEAILVGLAIDLDLCLCLCIRRNENDSKWHQRWSEFGWGSVGIFTGFRDFGILDWILPTKKVESVIWRVTKKLVPCHVIWDITQRRYYFTLRYVTLRYVMLRGGGFSCWVNHEGFILGLFGCFFFDNVSITLHLRVFCLGSLGWNWS